MRDVCAARGAIQGGGGASTAVLGADFTQTPGASFAGRRGMRCVGAIPAGDSAVNGSNVERIFSVRNARVSCAFNAAANVARGANGRSS